MFSSNPEDFHGAARQIAHEIVDAVAAGNWQRPEAFLGTMSGNILVQTADRTIWCGVRSQDGSADFQLDALDWLTVYPTGVGRTDIQAEMERRESLHLWAEAEMEADPEGAFGGHGNNV